MILYKKTTKDEPVNHRIAYLTKIANRWVKQIKCYTDRQARGENLQKHIEFAISKLELINNEIEFLRGYAE